MRIVLPGRHVFNRIECIQYVGVTSNAPTHPHLVMKAATAAETCCGSICSSTPSRRGSHTAVRCSCCWARLGYPASRSITHASTLRYTHKVHSTGSTQRYTATSQQAVQGSNLQYSWLAHSNVVRTTCLHAARSTILVDAFTSQSHTAPNHSPSPA